MKIVKSGFPSIINDNEETYFKHIEGIVSSLDEYGSVSVTKKSEGIVVRITPSDYKAHLNIFSEIKKLHTQFGLIVDFSKSMKSANNICYNINF
jgi:hypothetical protein